MPGSAMRLLVAALLLSVVAIFTHTGTAEAQQNESLASASIRERSVERFGHQRVRRYAHNHRMWTKRAGRSVVGRQIVKFGMPKSGPGHRVASKAAFNRSMRIFQRWNHPPAPAPVEYVSSDYAAPATDYSSGSGNATVQCESGGDYSANTGNGYYGGYQFDSGTWDAYGDPAYPEANMAPPAVQDQAAASVPYDAWPNC